MRASPRSQMDHLLLPLPTKPHLAHRLYSSPGCMHAPSRCSLSPYAYRTPFMPSHVLFTRMRALPLRTRRHGISHCLTAMPRPPGSTTLTPVACRCMMYVNVYRLAFHWLLFIASRIACPPHLLPPSFSCLPASYRSATATLLLNALYSAAAAPPTLYPQRATSRCLPLIPFPALPFRSLALPQRGSPAYLLRLLPYTFFLRLRMAYTAPRARRRS